MKSPNHISMGTKHNKHEKQVIKIELRTYNLILARASLNLIIASSCLTVIGIAAASPVSFACCLIFCKKLYVRPCNTNTLPTGIRFGNYFSYLTLLKVILCLENTITN